MSVNTIPVGSSDRTLRQSSPVAKEERSFTNHVSPHGYFSAFNPGFSQWGGSLVGVAYRTTFEPFRGDPDNSTGDFLGPAMSTRGKRERFRDSFPPGRVRPCVLHGRSC